MLRRIFAAYRGAFSGLPRPVWVLAAATLINRSGTMVLPFLALFLTEERGFTTAAAGRALAVYGLGALPGSYLGGWLSDRLGPRRVMVASLALTGAGFMLLGRLDDRAAILATLVAISVVGEAFRPANAGALAASGTPGERSKAFALSRLAINLGMTLGPAVGGFLAFYDYGWLFLVDGATCLAAAGLLVVSYQGGEAPPAPAPGAPAERSPWRDGPFLVLLLLVVALGAIFFQVLSTFPLALRDLQGFSEAQIGLVLAVNTLLIVAFEMVLVDAVKRLDPLAVVGAGSFFLGTGFALLPLGAGFAWVAFTIAVWTVGEMLTLPIVAAVVADRAGAGNQGRYMGLFSLAFAAAFIIAPLAGTWVYQRQGPAALWYGCGILGTALWAAFHLLGRRVR